MSGKVFDEYGAPIVTPVRMVSAVVAGVAVAVAGGVWASLQILFLGVSIVVVAFCVAIPVWRTRPYRNRPLAGPPAYAPVEVGAGRRVVRRPAGMGYLFAPVGGLLCLATMIRPTGSIDLGVVSFAGVGTAVCVASLATGPMAYFVVSARFLDICTATRVVRVPRHMIREFTAGRQEVMLHLTDGQSVDFRVDSVLWDLLDKTRTFTNPRSQFRTVDRIVTAMHAVPPMRVLDDFEVERIPRVRAVMGLAVGGLALFAVTIIRASAHT